MDDKTPPTPSATERELIRIEVNSFVDRNERLFQGDGGLVVDTLCIFVENMTSTLQAQLTEKERLLEVAMEALEKLSCLGNGDRLGNSDGNVIAQKALTQLSDEQ